MPHFILTYRGKQQPASPEEGAASQQKWMKWMQGMGDAMVNPGTPMMGNQIVAKDGSVSDAGSAALSGYSIVDAPDMDAAIKIAQACPFLEMGEMEVAQMMQMPS